MVKRKQKAVSKNVKKKRKTNHGNAFDFEAVPQEEEAQGLDLEVSNKEFLKNKIVQPHLFALRNLQFWPSDADLLKRVEDSGEFASLEEAQKWRERHYQENMAENLLEDGRMPTVGMFTDMMREDRQDQAWIQKKLMDYVYAPESGRLEEIFHLYDICQNFPDFDYPWFKFSLFISLLLEREQKHGPDPNLPKIIVECLRSQIPLEEESYELDVVKCYWLPFRDLSDPALRNVHIQRLQALVTLRPNLWLKSEFLGIPASICYDLCYNFDTPSNCRIFVSGSQVQFRLWKFLYPDISYSPEPEDTDVYFERFGKTQEEE